MTQMRVTRCGIRISSRTHDRKLNRQSRHTKTQTDTDRHSKRQSMRPTEGQRDGHTESLGHTWNFLIFKNSHQFRLYFQCDWRRWGDESLTNSLYTQRCMSCVSVSLCVWSQVQLGLSRYMNNAEGFVLTHRQNTKTRWNHLALGLTHNRSKSNVAINRKWCHPGYVYLHSQFRSHSTNRLGIRTDRQRTGIA